VNIIAIVNNKGGVGKTTTAQNVGAAIATFSKAANRVLLIDLDPQGSLTKSSGIRLKKDAKTSGSFILNKVPIQQVVVNYNNSSIDILPSNSSLLNDEEEIKTSTQFPFNLKEAIEKAPNKYDFVVIDCPPTLSALTKIALIACDRYYIPLQPEYLSYEGLREFINYANQVAQGNSAVALGGVFAIRFNPNANKKFSKGLIETVKKQLGGKLLNTYIRENSELYKAQAQGKHIFDYNKSSNGAIDYYNLTKEIILRQ